MKLMQLVQKNFAELGIDSNPSAHPFNHKVLFGLFLLGSTVISIFMYAWHEANTFIEYTECIYAIFIITCLIICPLAIVLTMSKSIEFFRFAEQVLGGEKILFWKRNVQNQLTRVSFRIWRPNNDCDVYRYKYSNREMQQNSLFCDGKNNTDMCDITAICCQLFPLFYHRCWKWCIWNDTFNVVSWCNLFVKFLSDCPPANLGRNWLI